LQETQAASAAPIDLGAALLERRMASQTSIAVCLEVVEQQASITVVSKGTPS
jgi:hypothetical protein